MTDTYAKRCNDQTEREQWRSSGLVRVDSLHRGDVFECVDGQFWRYEHKTKTGTIHASKWADMAVDGQASEDDFVSGAMVRPIMRKNRLFTKYGVEIPCDQDGNPMRDAPGRYDQAARAMGAPTEHRRGVNP